MKKIYIIIAVLAVIACITATAVSALGHTFTDVTAYDGAIGALSQIGVIRGRSSTVFDPDSKVTRWQMALLITKLTTGNTDDAHWKSASGITFTDVKADHYPGAVKNAADNGIIIGLSSTKFAPNDGITLQDAYTMAVRALGYGSSQMNAGYPNSFIDRAKQLGLSRSLSDIPETRTLTRGQTAQLLYNAFVTTSQSGKSIAETAFGYIPRRVMLTATPQQRISSAYSYPKSGNLAFCLLGADGEPQRTVYTLPEAYFDLESMADYTLNSLIGKSWDILSTDTFGDIIYLEECPCALFNGGLSVQSSGAVMISLDGNAYKPVSSLSYRLIDGIEPPSREIVFYGFGSMFTVGQRLNVSDLYSTCSAYSLRAYDDNADGYYDRACYIPYAFGLYSTSGSTITIKGTSTLSFNSQTVAFTGQRPSENSYITYRWDGVSSEVSVLHVYTPSQGYITSLGGGKVTIGNDAASSGIAYTLGDNSLYGASYERVSTPFTLGYSSYIGAKVDYIADRNGNILMINPLSFAGGAAYVQGDGYLSNATCAVIDGNIDTTGLVLNYVSVPLYVPGGGYTEEIRVSVINGEPTTSISARQLSSGDIIEYKFLKEMEFVPGSPIDLYSVNTITGKPYVKLDSSTAYTYYMGCSGYYFGVGHKINNQDKITYDGQVRVSAYTTVLLYDGANVIDITSSALRSGFEQSVDSGWCLYASINQSTGAAGLIYIRPDTDRVTQSDIDSFSTVAYLSRKSTEYDNISYSNGRYSYIDSVDMLTGATLTSYNDSEVGNGRFLMKYGCYKATVDSSGSLRILEAEPLTKDASSEHVSFFYQGSITYVKYDPIYGYIITLNGKTYTAESLKVYELNDDRRLLPYSNIASFADGSYISAEARKYCIGDVLMSKPDSLGKTSSVTIVIYYL